MKLKILLFAGALAAAPAAAETVTVIIKRSMIRKAPKHYAPPVSAVELGDRLESAKQAGGWHSVRFAGKAGWLHQSAVTAKTIKLGNAKNVGSMGTSADELTLAGKGFNAEVEKEYRKAKPQADFRAVDALEKKKTPEKDLRRFLAAGGLLEEAR